MKGKDWIWNEMEYVFFARPPDSIKSSFILIFFFADSQSPWDYDRVPRRCVCSHLFPLPQTNLSHHFTFTASTTASCLKQQQKKCSWCDFCSADTHHIRILNTTKKCAPNFRIIKPYWTALNRRTRYVLWGSSWENKVFKEHAYLWCLFITIFGYSLLYPLLCREKIWYCTQSVYMEMSINCYLPLIMASSSSQFQYHWQPALPELQK